MNNRILATLFALAIALFIGVAPVKAEAATHSHVDKDKNCVCDTATCGATMHNYEWKTDAVKHRQVCKTCGTQANENSHSFTVYLEKNATHHVAKCTVCGYTEDREHKAIPGECRCNDCRVILDCEMEWQDDANEHWKKCSNCGKETLHEKHSNETIVNNGDGTHSVTYTCCNRGTLVRNCSDSNTDKDCLCDVCKAPTANHKLVKVERKNATCTEDGSYGYYQCEFCKKVFDYETGTKETTLEALVIKAPGHKTQEHWTYDAEEHWHACSACKEEKVDLGKHVFKYTANNVYTHTGVCETCGNSINASTNQKHVDANNDCVCDAPGCGFLMHETKFVAAKEKTCTEDGWNMHHLCSKCGGKFYSLETYEKVDPTVPKSHDPYSDVYYDDAGHYQTCRACKAELNREAHELKYTAKNATQHYVECTYATKKTNSKECEYRVVVDHVDANKDCVCDLCNYKLEHKLTHVNSQDPTCTKDGNLPYDQCTVCKKAFDGDKKEIANVKIDMLGHDWDSMGMTIDGKHQMLCSRCNLYSNGVDHFSKDGDCFCDVDGCNELVHSHKLVFVPQVDAACGKAGTEEYYKYEGCSQMFDMNQNPISAPAVIPALAHVAGEDYEAIEGDLHAIKCSNCGEVMTTAAHADSNKDNRCDVCEVELALKYVEQQDPTCTSVGYKGYWVSEYTGRKYADANGNEYITAPEQIPSLGHLWNSANSTSHICGRCGATAAHVNQDSIECVCDTCYLPVAGHAITIVDEVAATCTKSGTQAYAKCECGKIYDVNSGEVVKSPIVIPSGGHKLASTVVNDTTTGEHYSVCTVCGKKVYSDHETVLEDPLKGNYHQWVCECGYSDPVTHKDTDGDNKCDECGHDMANTPVNVEQHDSVTVITGEKETVDNSKSWLWNWIDKLLPGTSGGTSTSKSSTSENTSSNISSGNTATSGTGSNASSGNTTTAPSGSGSASGSTSTSTGSSNNSTSTGIINEFIQWLSQLFNIFLQGK